MLQPGGSSPQQQQQQQQPKSHRRPHRKSRNGCVECKRRHIRCDERRPACANCAIAERTCVFPPAKEKGALRKRLSPSPSPSYSPSYSPGAHHQPSYAPSYAPPCAHEYHSRSPSTTAWSSGGARTPNETPLPQAQLNSQSHSHSQSQSQSQAHSHSYPYSHSHSHSSTSEPSPLPSFGESFPQSAYDTISDPPLFTAEHLSLLYHLTASQDDFFSSPGQDKHLLEISIRLASTHPYLIDQVLALSALHKAAAAAAVSSSSSSSSSSPDSSSLDSSPSHLRHLATELQTRAIARFTRQSSTLPPDDTESSIPRFLFAATLSLHDLADTLTSVRTLHHSQFHVFVNRFVDCFRIHHGIRAVIRPTWHHLLTSELEPLLRITQEARLDLRSSEANGSGQDGNGEDGGSGSSSGSKCQRGDECRPLHNLLDSSDLGPATVSACRGAVDQLQWAFDLYRNLPQPSGGPHAASAFSVTVSTEYIDVLRRLQPEAVVVLAYYGVLLHHCRRFWIFGDAGAFIVRAIAQHLGVYWEHVMAWPLSMVQNARPPGVAYK